jgi:hypothetical protein
MFVRGVNCVYVIVAMLNLIHYAGLKRFVCRATTPADRKRQQSDEQSFALMGDHDLNGLMHLQSNAVYLLTRLNVGDWT